jgi:hypothetical protein
MKGPKLILPIVASFFLCSCVIGDSVTKFLSLWTGDIKPEIYYVGLANLKLFSVPQSSRAYVAKLPLNEKILRYKVQKGFPM